MAPGKRRVAVLGAGSWGTALAILLARNGYRTVLWGRDASAMQRLAAARLNERYLPEHAFPPELEVVERLEAALQGATAALVVVPSHGFAETVAAMADHLDPGVGVAWATKGFDPASGRLLHEVAAERLGRDRALAILSGPTFAGEVAANLPAAVTLASNTPEFADEWRDLLHNDRFRVYTSEDLIGVQIGGGVKNVLAVAAGIADGLGFGANTRAALITRGLAELARFGKRLGGL